MKRFLLWDYPRAGWQYDVMVALILAFIFLTPREVFRDQPRASNIVLLPAESRVPTYWVESDVLTSLSEEQRKSKVEEMVRSRFGKRQTVIRLEPQYDPEKQLKGYIAYAKP